jgi:ribonucleotide reductase alpha subunit
MHNNVNYYQYEFIILNISHINTKKIYTYN